MDARPGSAGPGPPGTTPPAHRAEDLASAIGQLEPVTAVGQLSGATETAERIGWLARALIKRCEDIGNGCISYGARGAARPAPPVSTVIAPL